MGAAARLRPILHPSWAILAARGARIPLSFAPWEEAFSRNRQTGKKNNQDVANLLAVSQGRYRKRHNTALHITVTGLEGCFLVTRRVVERCEDVNILGGGWGGILASALTGLDRKVNVSLQAQAIICIVSLQAGATVYTARARHPSFKKRDPRYLRHATITKTRTRQPTTAPPRFLFAAIRTVSARAA